MARTTKMAADSEDEDDLWEADTLPRPDPCIFYAKQGERKYGKHGRLSLPLVNELDLTV